MSANKQSDKLVASYLRLESWLFLTTVPRPLLTSSASAATPAATPAAAPTVSVPRDMLAPEREATDKAEERRERRLRRNMAKSLPVLELGPLRNGGNFEVRKKN